MNTETVQNVTVSAKEQTETTIVVFRKFKDGGDVIALFPNEVADSEGNCSSYVHNGQHGAANYAHVMKSTVATTPEESQALQTELTGLGYALKVMKRHRTKSLTE